MGGITSQRRPGCVPGAGQLGMVEGVNDDAFPGPDLSDGDLWPGELPFTAFGQWGPGNIDLRVFDQDEWWVDVFGAPHRLDEMSDCYRRNVLSFLTERTEEWFAVNLRRAALTSLGNLLQGRVDGELMACSFNGSIGDVDAYTWLESTPLVRKLRKLTAGTCSNR